MRLSEEAKRRMSRLGYKHTSKAKKKISEALRGRTTWNKGVSPSQETKNKISIANKGRIFSEESKEKIRQSKLGEKNPNFGKKMGENQKRKISNSLKGRPSPMKGRTLSLEHRKKLKIARKNSVLPKKDTKIELIIKGFLEKLGIKYIPHHYISDIKYSYQCDFFLPKQKGIYKKTIVECDGDYWHGNPYKFNLNKINRDRKIQRCLDYERTYQLEEAGYRVIRLFESDINMLKLNQFEVTLCKN